MKSKIKFMKLGYIFLFVLLVNVSIAEARKIPGTNLDEKPLPITIIKRKVPLMSLEKLLEENNEINNYIGMYPPRLYSENQRNIIYKKWIDLVSDAEYYLSLSQNEQILYLLADLYRKGHNMDVVDSSNHAIKNLQICLNKYPKSLSCHYTSVYLYLSSGPDGLYKAEESLIFLRRHFAPELNSAVELAYITLYLHKRDAKNAKIQIEKFIDIFHNHQYAKLYKDILPALDDGISYTKE